MLIMHRFCIIIEGNETQPLTFLREHEGWGVAVEGRTSKSLKRKLTRNKYMYRINAMIKCGCVNY